MLLPFSVALAHVGLEEPAARYPTDGLSANKSCPCGVGANDSLCSVAELRSDPNRSRHVTAFVAGATITVRAHEVIGHSGRWRIAFDPHGADLDDFNDHVLLDVADPPGGEGNTGRGDLWEWEVTLPDAPCDDCTLQLVQVMDGDTTHPVADPTGRSTYYQCADLVLTEGPAGPPDDSMDSGSGDAATACGCRSSTAAPGGCAVAGLVAVLRRRRPGPRRA